MSKYINDNMNYNGKALRTRHYNNNNNNTSNKATAIILMVKEFKFKCFCLKPFE